MGETDEPEEAKMPGSVPSLAPHTKLRAREQKNRDQHGRVQRNTVAETELKPESYHKHAQLADSRAWHPAAAAADAAGASHQSERHGEREPADEAKNPTAFQGFRIRHTETQKQNKISMGNSFTNKHN